MEIQSIRASGLVVAAGSSRRMGFDKTTALLSGRPLVSWSLEAFEACDDIGPCALVCAASRLDEFAALAAPYKKFRRVVPGGAERADSVRNGLLALAPTSPTLVAVHDAARPLVTPALISQILAAAADSGAAVAAEPVGDSLHRAGSSSCLVETVSREGLWAMQTPQVAALSVLLDALDSARRNGAALTDEIAALIRAGLQPKAVFHGSLNFKVTFPRDLALAQAVFDMQRCA
jgi:2-C-methyl-D-erythritol 4-phosphate cytidylyltransferase